MPNPEFLKITPRNTFFNRSVYEGVNSLLNRIVMIVVISAIVYAYIMDKHYKL